MNTWLSSQDPLRQPRKGDLPRPLVVWEPVKRAYKPRQEWSRELNISFPECGAEKASTNSMSKYTYTAEYE